MIVKTKENCARTGFRAFDNCEIVAGSPNYHSVPKGGIVEQENQSLLIDHDILTLRSHPEAGGRTRIHQRMQRQFDNSTVNVST